MKHASKAHKNLIEDTIMAFQPIDNYHMAMLLAVGKHFGLRYLSHDGYAQFPVVNAIEKMEDICYISAMWDCGHPPQYLMECKWKEYCMAYVFPTDPTELQQFRQAFPEVCHDRFQTQKQVCFACCIKTENEKVRCPTEAKNCRFRYLDAIMLATCQRLGFAYAKDFQLRSEAIMRNHSVAATHDPYFTATTMVPIPNSYESYSHYLTEAKFNLLSSHKTRHSRRTVVDSAVAIAEPEPAEYAVTEDKR